MSGKSKASGRSSQGGNLVPALCNVLGILILLSVIASCLPMVIPQMMGYEVYNVVSGSMEPGIPVGSAVYVAQARPQDIRQGDIIAFRSGGSVITHRVVVNRIVEGEFVTKGDANAAEDMNTVEYSNLIGRVERHIPVIGELMGIYASSVGKAYLLCYAACGAMLNMLAGRLRDRRREKAMGTEDGSLRGNE